MATATLTRADEPLDTSIRLVTPERVTFRYPLAGPFRRAMAYVLDTLFILVMMVVGFVVSLTLSLGSIEGLGLFFVICFLLLWFYGGFCEAVFNGQTLGKRLLSLRVVSIEGVPITGGQAVLRNLLWAVEWALPFGFIPAILSMLLTRRFQRLGDLAAGTMVVVEERPTRGRYTRVREQAVEALLPYLPGRVAAGPELSQALADYVRHRGRFGPDRREEISGHLAGPLKKRFGLPDRASGDAVLCALYQRVFLGE